MLIAERAREADHRNKPTGSPSAPAETATDARATAAAAAAPTTVAGGGGSGGDGADEASGDQGPSTENFMARKLRLDKKVEDRANDLEALMAKHGLISDDPTDPLFGNTAQNFVAWCLESDPRGCKCECGLLMTAAKYENASATRSSRAFLEDLSFPLPTKDDPPGGKMAVELDKRGQGSVCQRVLKCWPLAMLAGNEICSLFKSESRPWRE